MKKYSKWKKNFIGSFILLALFFLTGCQENAGEADRAEEQRTDLTDQAVEGQTADKESLEAEGQANGIANESALDAQIDFSALQKENPDIFAWIHVPGTTIDYPVLQNKTPKFSLFLGFCFRNSFS